MPYLDELILFEQTAGDDTHSFAMDISRVFVELVM